MSKTQRAADAAVTGATFRAAGWDPAAGPVTKDWQVARGVTGGNSDIQNVRVRGYDVHGKLVYDQKKDVDADFD